MIYKDSEAHNDLTWVPACRPKYAVNSQQHRCLNCHKTHAEHTGWACRIPGMDFSGEFKNTPAFRRYITQEMKDSLTPDISDWRTWAHNKPGDCPCGIDVNMCDYHRWSHKYG